eukprot:TRINITY_DN4126_c0_g1_i1.p2 TRINITY_DN4126_c0_g1~~TRINITY_DN4126_c0_g1_i1.p2  ORF type:complete len:137 (-),score=27.96 TRINITY_DN4126_c0_g1_i1:194-604(-)
MVIFQHIFYYFIYYLPISCRLAWLMFIFILGNMVTLPFKWVLSDIFAFACLGVITCVATWLLLLKKDLSFPTVVVIVLTAIAARDEADEVVQYVSFGCIGIVMILTVSMIVYIIHTSHKDKKTEELRHYYNAIEFS